MHVSALLHQPPGFSEFSGMLPLVKALAADPVFYRETWRQVQERYWYPGHRLKWWGDAHYGSGWNALLPHVDEWRLSRKIAGNPDIIHFIWAEFASPRHDSWFRRQHRLLVGTYHASARKLPEIIWPNYRALTILDGITLMSETQKPFFLARGFPAERMEVILHGVVSNYFRPASRSPREDGLPLRGLLVGSTERDHAFMASIMRKIPPGTLQLTVLTNRHQQELYYKDAPGTFFPGQVGPDQLLALYQQSDLLVMPMIDCTANNAVMESMACGTPVMVNRVGGISEYVDPVANIILEGKNEDEWIDHLIALKKNLPALEARRPLARAWAERFDWSLIAEQYKAFYRKLAA